MRNEVSDDAMLIAFMIAFGFTSLNVTLATIFEAQVSFGLMATAALVLLLLLILKVLAAVWESWTAGTGGGAGGD